MVQISLATANRFYAWGWRASIAGAVITAIGVILLMWGTRVRDKHFELESTKSRLELERIRAGVASRRLTKEQVNKLADALSAVRDKLPPTTLRSLSTMEPVTYAEDILDAFDAANINVTSEKMDVYPIPYGLIIYDTREGLLTKAFGAAGINVEIRGPDPTPTIFVGQKPPSL